MKTLLIILVSSLLVSCTFGRQTAYRNVDIYLMYTINGYLDLNDTQEQITKAALKDILAWHQREELPLVAQFFRSTADSARDGLTEAEVEGVFQNLGERLGVIVKRIAPAAGVLLHSLSKEQIAYMERETMERQKNRFDNLDKPHDEALARLTKRMRSDLEKWIGALTVEQEKMVAAYGETVLPLRKVRRDLLPARNKSFAQMLRDGKSAEELARLFELRILAPRDGGESEWADLEEKIDQTKMSLYKQVYTNLNARQIAELCNNLADWTEDIEKLAQQVDNSLNNPD